MVLKLARPQRRWRKERARDGEGVVLEEQVDTGADSGTGMMKRTQKKTLHKKNRDRGRSQEEVEVKTETEEAKEVKTEGDAY